MTRFAILLSLCFCCSGDGDGVVAVDSGAAVVDAGSATVDSAPNDADAGPSALESYPCTCEDTGLGRLGEVSLSAGPTGLLVVTDGQEFHDKSFEGVVRIEFATAGAVVSFHRCRFDGQVKIGTEPDRSTPGTVRIYDSDVDARATGTNNALEIWREGNRLELYRSCVLADWSDAIQSSAPSLHLEESYIHGWCDRAQNPDCHSDALQITNAVSGDLDVDILRTTLIVGQDDGGPFEASFIDACTPIPHEHPTCPSDLGNGAIQLGLDGKSGRLHVEASYLNGGNYTLQGGQGSVVITAQDNHWGPNVRYTPMKFGTKQGSNVWSPNTLPAAWNDWRQECTASATDRGTVSAGDPIP